jgi:hypothetical protein
MRGWQLDILMLPLLWLLKYTRMTGSALYDVTFAGGLPGCDNLLSKNFLSVSTGRSQHPN